MTKARFRLMAAGLVAFSLVLSSCFTLRVIGISPKSLGPGDTAKINVKLYPVSSSTTGAAPVVLLIGLEGLDPGTVSNFDKKGNFGGPFSRVTDNAIRDIMLAECTIYGVDASAVEPNFDEWRAYRTIAAVNSAAGPITKAFKVSIEVDRAAGTDDTSFGYYVVFSGMWLDDGDGVVESGETVCNGMMGGSVAFKP